MKRIIFFFQILLITISALFSQEFDTIIDSRDGQVYKIVEIGQQWWMAENLRATSYIDGTPLYAGAGAGDISGKYSTRYYFWFDDDSTTNASTYGALYTWTAAMNSVVSSNINPSGVQGVCPYGWHLPSDAEWTEIIDYLGGSSEAGGKMKESGTSHWYSPNTGATNESGFTALPGGIRYYHGTFNHTSGYWWSATEDNTDLAFDRVMGYDITTVARQSENKLSGISVRCVLNDPHSLETEMYYYDTINCYGETIDSIGVVVSGGLPPYEILWSTGSSKNKLYDVPAGNYWVRVTDDLGEFVSDSFNIDQPDPLNVIIQTESALCHGDCVHLNISINGGTLPYHWESAPPDIDSCLVSGSYVIIIADALGCSDTVNFVFIEPSPLLVETNASPSCFEDSTGSISTIVTGGTSPYQYLWNNNETTASLSAEVKGIYTVTVTDNNGCDTVAVDSVGEYTEIITGQVTGQTNVNPAEVYIYSVNEKLTSVFNWSISGGNIVSGQGTNSINVQWGSVGSGMVSVVETDINGCIGDTVSLDVLIGSTGVNNTIENDLRIYPNPSSDISIIEFPNPNHEPYHFILSDLSGKVVKIMDNITQDKVEMDRNNLPNGLYLIELRGPRIYRGKILIE